MPAYKVPCPRCANFIMRDVAVCPFCGTKDPFAPIRCESCRAVIEDPRWVACQRCGTPVPKPAGNVAAAPAASPGTPAAAPAPPAAQGQRSVGSARSCSSCGAPLTAGSRFCNVCGTLAG